MEQMTDTTLRAGFIFRDTETHSVFTDAFARSGLETAFAVSPAISVKDSLDEIPADFKKGVLVADLSREADPLDACRALADHVGPGVELVVFGDDNRLDTYRTFQKAGAADYWAKPVKPAEVAAMAAARLAEPAENLGDAKSIFFVDTAYGTGAGVLAAAAALKLSAEKKSVAVDCDFRHPVLGAYLGMDREGNLPLLLDAADRIDNELLSQAVTGITDKLHLLDGYLDDADLNVSYGNLEQRLKRLYARQIWRVSGAVSLKGLPWKHADAVVAVVAGNMVSLKGAANLKARLAVAKTNARVLWVFNKTDAGDAIPAETMEKHLGLTFDVKIDYVKKMGALTLDAEAFKTDANAVTRGTADILARAGLTAGNGTKSEAWWSKLWK